jgi:hypothetical protein
MELPPVCIACNRGRTLIAVKPVAKEYVMRSFECPGCMSILRLVAQRVRPASKGS